MNDKATVEARFRALEARIASLEATREGASRPRCAAASGAALPSAPPVPPRSRPTPLARLRVHPRRPAPMQAVGSGVLRSASRRTRRLAVAQVIAELEEKLTGRALAVVGGVALVVGRDLLPEPGLQPWLDRSEGRVLIGIGAPGSRWRSAPGCSTIASRPWAACSSPSVWPSLVVVFAATRLYGLDPGRSSALLGTLAAAIGAAYLAVRTNAEIIVGAGPRSPSSARRRSSVHRRIW